MQRRAAEEEELMMRVPLAKSELKGLRAAQNNARFSGGAMLDDFADDVADLVQVPLLILSLLFPCLSWLPFQLSIHFTLQFVSKST